LEVVIILSKYPMSLLTFPLLLVLKLIQCVLTVFKDSKFLLNQSLSVLYTVFSAVGKTLVQVYRGKRRVL
jgi:hypothetical protein